MHVGKLEQCTFILARLERSLGCHDLPVVMPYLLVSLSFVILFLFNKNFLRRSHKKKKKNTLMVDDCVSDMMLVKQKLLFGAISQVWCPIIHIK